MRKYLWSFLLFILCSVPLWEQQIENQVVALLLIATFLLLTSFASRGIQVVGIIGFVLTGYFSVTGWYFVPLLFYQLMYTYGWYSTISLALLFLMPSHLVYALVLAICGGFLAYFEKERESVLQTQTGAMDLLRFQLMKEEESLQRIEKEHDQEKQMAILQERNRIARSVHDAVGHSLSRAIIQLQAIQLVSKDHQEELAEISKTLQMGMDDIRSSLHKLHDESIDLQKEIEKLTEAFHLPVRVQCNIAKEYSYAFKRGILSVIKESLSNIRKHSNATQVELTLVEHPQWISLIVQDNGTYKEVKESGMGLFAMQEFAGEYGGQCNYGFSSRGFFIHLRVQKEKA